MRTPPKNAFFKTEFWQRRLNVLGKLNFNPTKAFQRYQPQLLHKRAEPLERTNDWHLTLTFSRKNCHRIFNSWLPCSQLYQLTARCACIEICFDGRLLRRWDPYVATHRSVDLRLQASVLWTTPPLDCRSGARRWSNWSISRSFFNSNNASHWCTVSRG